MKPTSIAVLIVFAAGSLFAQTAPAPPAVTPVPSAATPPSSTSPPADALKSALSDNATLKYKLADWASLGRYRADDAALPTPAPGEQRVVFLGDSITDSWGRGVGVFFPGKQYINRGISGQTTPQMLVRFEQDVVRLHPAAVVILAGTNDIAGNTGPSSPQMIEDNFRAMSDIARQNGIKVVLASITPVFDYPWRSGIHPAPIIREVNQWLKDYCAAQHLVYLDYYSAMTNTTDATATGAMKPGLSSDGVHPTAAGYAVMAPLAEAAIAQALEK